MWLFTRYGFFSIVSDWTEAGRLLIRARRKKHLQALQTRFPELSSLEISRTDDRDYRYRFVIAKDRWVPILSELAREQTWTNFKDEVGRFQQKDGSDYTHVLNQVWNLMKKFQDSAPSTDDPTQ
ncbi:MAG TPA: hypothetical protein VH477_09595 [Bryobacteraceae bacterium]|jgi:hypothetical protein